MTDEPWRRIALPSRTVPWAARPVVRGAAVALGCSEAQPAPGPTPVVAVHDLDGSPGFAITYDAEGPWEIETSEPAIDHAGVVRALVYEHEVELVVVAAHVGGALLPRTSLGSEYPLRASDSGPKLGTRIAACPDGGFIASWEYRQVRQYFLGKFVDGAPAPLWSAPEWLLATTRDAVLGATAPSRDRLPADDSLLVCHDHRDGRVLWELDHANIDVAGAADGELLLIDRTGRHAEHERARAAADADFLAGRIGEPELQARWNEWPRSPTTVRIVDAMTGDDRAAFDVADDVFAAHLAGGRASVLASDANGLGRLVIDAMVTPVPGYSSSEFPPRDGELPALVGHVAGVPLWIDATGLHGAVSLPLPPADASGFERRIRDRRLARPNAIIAAGHVYLRSGDALWIAAIE